MTTIKGLNLVKDFISTEEENRLISCVDKCEWNNSLARRTQHYGYIYDYNSKGTLTKTVPIPDWCEFVTQRLVDNNILSNVPDQMIINEYIPGQGIYPHVDDVKSFDDGIVSLSLLSDICMDLIGTNFQKKEILLPRRSIVAFHEEARYEWRHGIASRKSDHSVRRCRRVSLTFRKVTKT